MQQCQGSSAWTLHGLWAEWGNDCEGAKFDINALSSIMGDLKSKWPSCPEYGQSNEEFWEHEWTKHGTCSGMGEAQFFSKAMSLRDQHQSKCGSTNECSVCFSKDLTTILDCPSGSEQVASLFVAV
jgi:ribonuclease T2